MATRNRNGRNLVSSNPNGSKIAYAKYLTIKNAEEMGLKTKQVVDYITQSCSLQALEIVKKRFGLIQ